MEINFPLLLIPHFEAPRYIVVVSLFNPDISFHCWFFFYLGHPHRIFSGKSQGGGGVLFYDSLVSDPDLNFRLYRKKRAKNSMSKKMGNPFFFLLSTPLKKMGIFFFSFSAFFFSMRRPFFSDGHFFFFAPHVLPIFVLNEPFFF